MLPIVRYRIPKNCLTEFSTDWLTVCPISSHKFNSMMAKVMSLTFSPLDVASAQQMPFYSSILHYDTVCIMELQYLCSPLCASLTAQVLIHSS